MSLAQKLALLAGTLGEIANRFTPMPYAARLVAP
jgi:hypothetical protein